MVERQPQVLGVAEVALRRLAQVGLVVISVVTVGMALRTL